MGTHSEWVFHSSNKQCIALARNGTFIPASANPISFCDPTIHKQIGDALQSSEWQRRQENNPPESERGPSPILFHQCTCSDKYCRLPSDMTCSWLQIDLREPDIRRMGNEITDLDKTNKSLRSFLRAHERKYQGEASCSEGHLKDPADLFASLWTPRVSEIKTNKILWIGPLVSSRLSTRVLYIEISLLEFTIRCVAKLESMGDAASNAEKHDEAIVAYSTALSLSSPKDVSMKWTKTVLVHSSINGALSTVIKVYFTHHSKSQIESLNIHPRPSSNFQSLQSIRQSVMFRKGQTVSRRRSRSCKRWRVSSERIQGCTKCTYEQWVLSKLLHRLYDQWLFTRPLDFRQRSTEKLEKLGDAATSSRKYAEAVEQYSTMLSRKPTNIVDILVKRSRARSLMCLWLEALDDAEDVHMVYGSHSHSRPTLINVHQLCCQARSPAP